MPRTVEAVLIVALCFLTRVPSLFEPLAMDQSLFAVIARGLLRGERLYADLWDHKPPGIYLLYAAAIRLFGSGAWSIAFASIAAQCTTSLLVRAIVRRYASDRTALLSGVLYAVIANPILLGGFYATGQAEVFIEPLVLGAILFVAAASPRAVVLSGVAFGAAVALKPTALLFAGLIAAMPRLLRDGAACETAASISQRTRLRRFFAGALVAPLLSFVYIVATGTLAPAVDALAGWNAASLRAGGASALMEGLSPHPFAILALLFDGILHLGPFLIFSALGLVPPRARGLLLAWLGVAILTVIVQGKLYRYHYQFVLAPLMALAAIGVAVLAQHARKVLARAAAPVVAAGVVVSLIPFGALVRDYWREHRDAFAPRHAAADPDALASYTWSSTGMRYADAARVAEIVRAGSGPADRIYVLGFDPQVYLLADRAPAGRYLAHDHIRYPGGETRLRDDLVRSNPRWVVVATDQVGPRDFALVAEWIAAHTEPRGAVGRFALFERVR
ncbi:MAG: ArnT family glycosyltransferase [bacterium]